jgi:hypothetical protein
MAPNSAGGGLLDADKLVVGHIHPAQQHGCTGRTNSCPLKSEIHAGLI